MEISVRVCFELSCKINGLKQETKIYPTNLEKNEYFYVPNSSLLKQIQNFCVKLQKTNEPLNMHLVRVVNVVVNGTDAEVAPSMRIVDNNSVFDFTIVQDKNSQHTQSGIVVDSELNQIWPPKQHEIGPKNYDNFQNKPAALMNILTKKTANIQIR
jgi:hypothetical protein